MRTKLYQSHRDTKKEESGENKTAKCYKKCIFNKEWSYIRGRIMCFD